MIALLDTLRIPIIKSVLKLYIFNMYSLTAHIRQIMPDPILNGMQPQHLGCGPNMGCAAYMVYFYKEEVYKRKERV